jgi:hypothetical protein
MKRKKPNNKKWQKPHPYDKWVAFRGKMREDDIRLRTQIKVIADFLNKVLPYATSGRDVSRSNVSTTRTKIGALPSTSTTTRDGVYETPKEGVVKTEEQDGDTT